MNKKYDDKKIYCRKLGHHLTFKYSGIYLTNPEKVTYKYNCKVNITG